MLLAEGNKNGGGQVSGSPEEAGVLAGVQSWQDCEPVSSPAHSGSRPGPAVRPH